jgi:hypothetical protein
MNFLKSESHHFICWFIRWPRSTSPAFAITKVLVLSCIGVVRLSPSERGVELGQLYPSLVIGTKSESDTGKTVILGVNTEILEERNCLSATVFTHSWDRTWVPLWDFGDWSPEIWYGLAGLKNYFHILYDINRLSITRGEFEIFPDNHSKEYVTNLWIWIYKTTRAFIDIGRISRFSRQEPLLFYQVSIMFQCCSEYSVCRMRVYIHYIH